MTHVDTVYHVSITRQFMSAPTVKHWETLKEILYYLKCTPALDILFNNQWYIHIECFTDAD